MGRIFRPNPLNLAYPGSGSESRWGPPAENFVILDFEDGMGEIIF